MTSSATIDLDQQGLTGLWYEAATSGQGFGIEIYPDYSGSGVGLVQGSWFTFDTSAGGAATERWYTFGGSMISGASYGSFQIFRNTGGNFDAGPITTAQAIGSGTLAFSSCAQGVLTYAFTDGSGRAGTIPLSRLTPNVTCSTTGARATNADFALSGH
jgi:hypothetical protein